MLFAYLWLSIFLLIVNLTWIPFLLSYQSFCLQRQVMWCGPWYVIRVRSEDQDMRADCARLAVFCLWWAVIALPWSVSPPLASLLSRATFGLVAHLCFALEVLFMSSIEMDQEKHIKCLFVQNSIKIVIDHSMYFTVINIFSHIYFSFKWFACALTAN